ncbi:MAG: hypothetical protein ACOYXR_11635 [Nitrospirota bacterium]
MSTIADPTTTSVSLPAAGTGSAPSLLGDPIRAKLKTKVGAQLTVLTTEGDVVTISGRSSLRVSCGTYDRCGRYGDDAGTTVLRASLRQQFSLSIQGTLSDQELADIDSLLGTIEEVFNRAMSAAPDGASAAGLSLSALDGLDSISAVTGALTYSSKVSATYVVPAPTPAEPPAAEAGDPVPSETAGGTGAPAPSGALDLLVRVKSSYQVTQQIAFYRQAAEHAPAPGPDPASSPMTAPADSAPPVADTTVAPLTPPSPAPDVAGAASAKADPVAPPTPAPAAGSPAPMTPVVSASPLDAVAQAAASQISAAVMSARHLTSSLFDTITHFLDALVGQAADQAGADSVNLYVAQSIRVRVVQHLTAQAPATSPAPADDPSGAMTEPVAATPSTEPAGGAPA